MYKRNHHNIKMLPEIKPSRGEGEEVRHQMNEEAEQEME